MKKITQTDVVEAMLLNNQLVTASTVYKETKRVVGIASVNHHKLLAGLKKKGYKIKDYWMQDKKGNRYKMYELKTK